MLDRDHAEDMFDNLDRYLATLRRLAQLSHAEFMADEIVQSATKYNLQVAIQACIDVAQHIIARQGFRSPETYAESFTILAENGILDKDFAITAANMVKMRNILVHLYLIVDEDQVYDVISHKLGDFDRFKAAIYKYLQSLE